MNNEELLDKRFAFVRRIVSQRNNIGKTKIQKICYFLQEAVGVELMYPFRMHYYGPYSDELDRTLSLASSVGFIDIMPDLAGFGYHVTASETGSTWPQWYDIANAPDIQRIDEAIDVLATLETYELELYATIHFINGRKSNLSKDQTLDTVGRIKPKFTHDQIDRAYQTLKKVQLI